MYIYILILILLIIIIVIIIYIYTYVYYSIYICSTVHPYAWRCFQLIDILSFEDETVWLMMSSHGTVVLTKDDNVIHWIREQ